MATKIKQENGKHNVYYNGLYVASISFIEGDRAALFPYCPTDWHCDHYALVYRSGRYERFETLSEAKDEAGKIMARETLTGSVELF